MSDMLLQYKVELGLAGMTDCPAAWETSLPDRLHRITRYRLSRTEFMTSPVVVDDDGGRRVFVGQSNGVLYLLLHRPGSGIAGIPDREFVLRAWDEIASPLDSDRLIVDLAEDLLILGAPVASSS